MPPQNSQIPVVESVPVAPKMGKFKASRILFSESWAVLRQDKEILWFPVISAILSIISLVVVSVFFYYLMLRNNFDFSKFGGEGAVLNASDKFYLYSFIFVCYIFVLFIVNFFQSGLFTIVQARFSGNNLSFKEGFSGAKRNVGKIFVWSLISATVGVILQIIANSSKKLGQIVASLLGTAWNILTYFSLPALVVGGFGVLDSFKESASMIRRTWGETFILNFGVSAVLTVATFVVFVFSAGLVFLFPSAGMLVGVIIFFIIFAVCISVLSSTLNSIFKLALYNYARTGQVPVGFSPDVIKSAVK
jgi:Family of unknown function (DUF6159)